MQGRGFGEFDLVLECIAVWALFAFRSLEYLFVQGFRYYSEQFPCVVDFHFEATDALVRQ